MKNKIIYLFLGLLVIVTGVYFQHGKVAKPVVSGQTFDRSVKVEYGQPIKVAHVIDGDTIELINGERLRYIGMDTPEEFDPRKPVQCFAKEAAEHNRQMVEGKEIKFYKDMTSYDKYGRWLGFVYLADGTFVNLELVKQGYAFAYPFPPDISKFTEFQTAETVARTAKLGLWGGCTISSTSYGREQTNPVK